MGKPLRPEKTCPVCQRPFQWRARWKHQWDEIVYCSKRCRSSRHTLKHRTPVA
ncbi:MAG: DUF2256 domain-containing protein [Halioglobus sp.]